MAALLGLLLTGIVASVEWFDFGAGADRDERANDYTCDVIGMVLLALTLPLGTLGGADVSWLQQPLALGSAFGLLLGAGALRWRGAGGATAVVVLTCIWAAAPLIVLSQEIEIGMGDVGFWLYLAAIAALAMAGVRRIAAIEDDLFVAATPRHCCSAVG